MSLQNQTPVPILQNEWEFKKFLRLYADHRPERILEIGTFFGGTLYHWINEGTPISITCVDLPIGPDDGRYTQMLASRALWPEWTYRLQRFYDIQGDSHNQSIIDSAHAVNPEGVDFIFIDGDHSYEGVKADYENYIDLIRPGGMVAFHDVIGYNSVNQFWNEVKNGKKYTEICASGPDGWAIGVLFF